MAHIFKPIEDARKNVLYAKEGTLKERMKKYNCWLAKNVTPELYVRYLVNLCDIYVDGGMIIVCTQNVYGEDLNEYKILSWAEKYMNTGQFLTI